MKRRNARESRTPALGSLRAYNRAFQTIADKLQLKLADYVTVVKIITKVLTLLGAPN